MRHNWKPSRAAARAFAQEMDEIRRFCMEHGIDASASMDSYYFTIRGQRYRVSNHSVEASNAAAWDADCGTYKREVYHPGGREEGVRYIHAGKTRIREIWEALNAGRDVDGRGNVI